MVLLCLYRFVLSCDEERHVRGSKDEGVRRRRRQRRDNSETNMGNAQRLQPTNNVSKSRVFFRVADVVADIPRGEKGSFRSASLCGVRGHT